MESGMSRLHHVRLDITRDTELLNQFVRVNVDDDFDDDQDVNASDVTTAAAAATAMADKQVKGDEHRGKDSKEVGQMPLGTSAVTDNAKGGGVRKQTGLDHPDDDERSKKLTFAGSTARRSKHSKKQRSARDVGGGNKKRVIRRKRKRIRPEELYTDKDRAAAVNMGTKDIKHSLKEKHQQDRSAALQIPVEAEPGTFLALGNYEMSRGDNHIARDFINKALELNPEEKNALVARSRCHILLGQPDKGLEDAEAALQIDKGFIKAIYQKAESLYHLGDFEHSLMYFHRGNKLRPEHAGFKQGIQKSQKAIENAIGCSSLPIVLPGRTSRVSSSSADTKDTTKTVALVKEASASTIGSRRPRTTTAAYPHRPKTALPITDGRSTKSCTSSNSTKMSTTSLLRRSRARSAKPSHLLRELAVDKDYLDNLITNPDLKCKCDEDDTRIVQQIQEAIDYLNTRQEFWRQQLPPHLK